MVLINQKLEFIGSGKIKANVDTILFEDTYLTDTLAVAEAGHADLDVRFVSDSILGALNELMDGLTDSSGVATSGTAELLFTPASGIEFVMEHGLETEIWAWDMWCTDVLPIASIMPENVYPSGINHVAVVLDQAASGRLVLTVGGRGPRGEQGVAGPTAFEPVDARQASGSIIPDTSGLYDLGAEDLRWRNVFATSGTFGTASVLIEDGIQIDKASPGASLTINHTSESEAAGINQATNQDVLRVEKTATGAGDCIQVDNAGTGRSLIVNQTGAGTAIHIVQSTARRGLLIQKTNTGSSEACQIEQAGTVPVLHLDAQNASFTERALFVKATRASSSAFTLAEFLSDNGGDPKVRLRGDGLIQSDIAASTPADYAEYFECADVSGIAPGYAVKLNTDGMIEAAASGESVLGFTSAAPGFVGDSAWSSWHEKYLKDDFGAKQLDVSGHPTLNPAWNSGLEYESREDRLEWVTVGLLGKIWVRTYGETLLSGDSATLGVSGMITKATDQEPNWLVVASGLSYDAAKGYGTARILYR